MSQMNFEQLVDLCQQTHLELKGRASKAIDSFLVTRNFLMGWYIVEFEQCGEDRAEYGKQTLKRLSTRLKAGLGRGFSVDNLEGMRRFFLAYRPQICSWEKSGTLSRIFIPSISETVSRNLNPADARKTENHDALTGKDLEIRQTVSAKSPSSIAANILRQALPELTTRFTLGWSQYVSLLTINDLDERNFYEIEAAANQWSVRELERQIASSLYQRLALSRDKDEVRRLAIEGQVVEKAADLIKDPLVLEFLGLNERPHYSEDDLESAIIDKLETFLLELGKGFLFEARQKRFTFDNDHFYVDLVFYNRLLRCYVLIDLKRDKLTHQDLGQMQMYVNYFDRHVKTEDELPTVGMVLCSRKNDALVELTLPEGSNIHASEYQLYLPSKEELKAQLEQITHDLGGGEGR